MSEPLQDTPADLGPVDSHTVYEGAVWHIDEDRFRLGETELVRQVLRHPGSVAILALDEQDRVGLVNQYRHPVARRLWELPAGLLDVPGESPRQAAARELREEIDRTADSWEPLTSYYSSPGGSDELLQIFRATGLHSVAPFAREAEEADFRYAWVPFPELLDRVRSGLLRSPSLVVGVLAEADRRAGRR
ncbi:MAG: NUDIX hydrolase [Microbacteriaceae bacterium]|nr:NUDIX hydrolase [Microbacteriaceae bacterium]MCI1207519.1 NUDIX hydrolase [Microbacteriaceae bacterium]